MLGIGVRIAAVAGALMLVMMWSAALWPETNPFMDYHLTESLALGVLALTRPAAISASAQRGPR